MNDLKSLIEFELYFIITSSEACDDNLQVVILVRDEESIVLLGAAFFYVPAVNSLLAINLDTSSAPPIGS